MGMFRIVQPEFWGNLSDTFQGQTFLIPPIYVTRMHTSSHIFNRALEEIKRKPQGPYLKVILLSCFFEQSPASSKIQTLKSLPSVRNVLIRN